MSLMLRLAGMLSALALLSVPRVDAHHLVGMQIGRYIYLVIEGNGITGRYRVNFENVPAFNERRGMDRDKDGSISQEESDIYLAEAGPRLADGLVLELDGRRVGVVLAKGKLNLGKTTTDPEPFQMSFELVCDSLGLR